MPPVAYALREEYAGTVQQIAEEGADPVEVPAYTGGVIVVDRGTNPDGSSPPDGFDVREELDANDGVIVVDETDAALIGALDQYPALKRVPAPDDAAIVHGYADRTAGELRGEAKRRGITGAGSASIADLVTALEAWDDRTADLATGENLGEVRLADLLAPPQGTDNA